LLSGATKLMKKGSVEEGAKTDESNEKQPCPLSFAS
jgi:hypothetical protein